MPLRGERSKRVLIRDVVGDDPAVGGNSMPGSA
jgi:hypothetical protein